MVLINATTSSLAPAPCELKMESGRSIRYVAPLNANPRKETRCNYEEVKLTLRKNSLHDRSDQVDDWEGVNSLCQTLDAIVEIELETDIFIGKTILEIGFTTGLPSVYAYENGAAEVALHSTSKSALELYCKPTMKRNAIPDNRCKFSSGDLKELRKVLGGKKFHVILAPELLNRSEEEFEMVHDIIDEALSDDGICLFSGLSYYFNVDGCLDSFLALVKRRRQFDALERWSSPRTDIVQRKVIQLTRSLF